MRSFAERTNAIIVVPPVARHALVDLELRQYAKRLETDFMAFCDLAREAIEGAYWAKLGFSDEAAYFQDIGVSYRSLRRRLAIVEALDGLSNGDRTQARAALAELGVHKAGVLSPLFEEGHEWRGWVERAKTLTEDQLQEEVSHARGLPPRGPASAPGERFLRMVLNYVPPETRQEVDDTFRAGMQLANTQNPLVVFLAMVHECYVEWSQRLRHFQD